MELCIKKMATKVEFCVLLPLCAMFMITNGKAEVFFPLEDANAIRNLTVLGRSNFTLKCQKQISSRSKNTVWYHNDIEMTGQDDSWRITRRGTLHLSSVTLHNTGSYVCSIPDMHGTVSWRRSFNIKIEVPANIIMGPKETQANWGDLVTLQCRASGMPDPDLHWLKDNKPVVDATTRLLYKNSSLIVNVTETSIYTCLAQNIVHTGRTYANKSASVSLKYTGDNDSTTSKSRHMERTTLNTDPSAVTQQRGSSHPAECLKANGISYKGNVNRTYEGYICQSWTSQQPHMHTFEPESFPSLLGAGNSCRNPGGKRQKPWCFTTSVNKQWQYCAIPQCESSKDGTVMKQDSELTLGYAVLIPTAAVFILTLFVLTIAVTCKLKRKKPRSRDYLVTPMHDFDFGVDKLPTNQCYHHRLPSISESIKLERYEYPRNDLEFLEDIGEGAFGRVFKARAPRLEKHHDSVVVKTMREDATMQMKHDFAKEADLMCEFDHPNVLKLLAVCTIGKPMCAIVEYMKHGELRQFLHERSPEYYMIRHGLVNNNQKDWTPIPTLSTSQKLHITTQIANGMLFLSEKGFVHRDLATRNCLVGENLCVKIADFGLTKNLQGSSVYYADEEEPIPIRWLPLETILFNHFTHESDVWSFGVVMWEVFSYAMQPYYGQTHQEVIDYLKSGQVLQCPVHAPEEVYELMKLCWSNKAENRSSFKTLYQALCYIEDLFDKRTRVTDREEIGDRF